MKNNFKSILKNINGFSMVETLVALGLFGAVAFVGLKQSEMMGTSSNELNLEREIIDFQSGIQGLVNNTAACETSFQGKTVPFTIDNLADKNGNTAYSSVAPNNTYLDNKLKIVSMNVTQKAANYFLDIEFEKIDNSKSMKTFSKFIELMIEVDGSNKVLDCFNIDNSMDETIQYLVAKNLCEKTYGVNTPEFNNHFDATNKTCSFKGFESSLNLQCSSGQALTGIAYEPATNKFTPICNSPFNSLGCPDGWVKSLNSSGQFTCASLSTYVDSTETNMALPATCKLLGSATDTQIKLICGTNSPTPSLGNRYKCTSTSFSSAGASCTPSNSSPSLCDSGSTVNEGSTICCASSPSSTCGLTSTCTPKGCSWYQNQFGPITQTGCTTQHDDCGTNCSVTGSCNTSGSTSTCLMCNTGSGGTCNPSTECCHRENGVLVFGPPCI